MKNTRGMKSSSMKSEEHNEDGMMRMKSEEHNEDSMMRMKSRMRMKSTVRIKSTMMMKMKMRSTMKKVMMKLIMFIIVMMSMTDRLREGRKELLQLCLCDLLPVITALLHAKYVR